MQAFRVLLRTSAIALLLTPPGVFGFQQSPGTGPDPNALVRRATQNELAAFGPGQPARFKLRKADERNTTTKEIIETKDGNVARLIAIADKPLTTEQAKAEEDRLEKLLTDPSIQARRQKREKEDSSRANKMIKLLPNAFLYTYAGMAEGHNGPCYRLTFRPNPQFVPPDREAQVYHGMAGEIWVDKNQERLVKLDARLIEDVDFGWGILGRLYKGGTLVVEQSDVGSHHWETTHMKLNITGKILMFKTLRLNTTEDAFDFQLISQMGYREAIKILQADKPQVAHR